MKRKLRDLPVVDDDNPRGGMAVAALVFIGAGMGFAMGAILIAAMVF